MLQNFKTLQYLNPARLGATADGDMATEALSLDRAQAGAGRLLLNMFPDTCYELLADWERVYGLSPESDASTGARIAALIAKIRAKGGLSRAYFISLADALGYEIEIEEPDAFMAGWSCAGEHLTGADIVFLWWVRVLNTDIPAYRFYAGSCGAGDRLCDFDGIVLETIFNDLKPAETLVFFAYQSYAEG